MADETYRKDYDPNWRDTSSDTTTDNLTTDDDVQHGIDDNPTGDAEKGAVMGGLGGAAVGAAAGMMAGPAGAVLGAVIGGVAGAVGSGVAVGAVDRVDNDNTVSGIGGGTTPEKDSATNDYASPSAYDTTDTYDNTQPNLRKSWDGETVDVDADLPGNRVPGVQTGGTNADGSTDTRGIWEKAEDTATGDVYDDKTGKRVA